MLSNVLLIKSPVSPHCTCTSSRNCCTFTRHESIMWFYARPVSMQALSRAFRNRFLELHIDDIPMAELAHIVEKRCLIPARYRGKAPVYGSNIVVPHPCQVKGRGARVFCCSSGSGSLGIGYNSAVLLPQWEWDWEWEGPPPTAR